MVGRFDHDRLQTVYIETKAVKGRGADDLMARLGNHDMDAGRLDPGRLAERDGRAAGAELEMIRTVARYPRTKRNRIARDIAMTPSEVERHLVADTGHPASID